MQKMFSAGSKTIRWMSPDFVTAHFLTPTDHNVWIHNYKITSLPSFSEFVLRSQTFFTSYKNTNCEDFKRDLKEASNSILPPINQKEIAVKNNKLPLSDIS